MSTLVPATSRPRSEVRPSGSSFAGLVGVELRRAWWRRLTRVLLAAAVLFVGAAVYNAYTSTSPELIAQRLDDYAIMLEQAKRDLPQQVEQCRTAQAEERERSGDQTVDYNCDLMGQLPRLEDMGIVPPVADSLTAGIATTSSLLLSFLCFVLGASLVGAEFTSGSMSTWLTFHPRRVRVAASKLLAVALGSAALAAVALALTTLGARAVAVVNRPGADVVLPPSSPLSQSVPQLLVRVVLISVLAGLCGAALALVLRHTAAAVLALLGWVVAVEGVAAQAFRQGRLKPWTLGTNLEGFVQLGTTYTAESCTADACTFSQHALSFTHAWVYLLVVGVAIVLVGVLAFRRRDVA